MKTDLRDLVLIVALAAMLAPPLHRRWNEWHWNQCKQKMYFVEIVLSVYASEHGGRYPRSLTALPSDYRKYLPTCPVTGSDYTEAYRASPDLNSCELLRHLHGAPQL